MYEAGLPPPSYGETLVRACPSARPSPGDLAKLDPQLVAGRLPG